MYLEYFGFEKPPFSMQPDVDFYCPFSSHEEGRKLIEYSIKNQDHIIKLTGEVGFGKSLLIEQLTLEMIEHHCCTIQNPNTKIEHLINNINKKLPIDQTIETDDPLEELEKRLVIYHKEKKPVVLIIDEAQTISPQILESLRLFTNLKHMNKPLMQIILVGQPELDTLLADPRLKQIRQRINFSHHIKALSYTETKQYIHHRIANARSKSTLLWQENAYQAIYKYSHGIPRLISNIAHKSLLLAHFDQTMVIKKRHVVKAAKYCVALDKVNDRPQWPISLAKAVAASAFFFYLYSR